MASNISLKRKVKYLHEHKVMTWERKLIMNQILKEASVIDSHQYYWTKYMQTHKLFPRIQLIDARLRKIDSRLQK